MQNTWMRAPYQKWPKKVPGTLALPGSRIPRVCFQVDSLQAPDVMHGAFTGICVAVCVVCCSGLSIRFQSLTKWGKFGRRRKKKGSV